MRAGPGWILGLKGSVVSNSGLVAGVVVGAAFLVAGVFLLKRSPSRGGAMVTAGAVLLLGAELYGLIELKPFIGRNFDEQWQEQIAGIEGVAMFGLLLCAAGVVAHALRLPKR